MALSYIFCRCPMIRIDRSLSFFSKYFFSMTTLSWYGDSRLTSRMGSYDRSANLFNESNFSLWSLFICNRLQWLGLLFRYFPQSQFWLKVESFIFNQTLYKILLSFLIKKWSNNIKKSYKNLSLLNSLRISTINVSSLLIGLFDRHNISLRDKRQQPTLPEHSDWGEEPNNESDDQHQNNVLCF